MVNEGGNGSAFQIVVAQTPPCNWVSEIGIRSNSTLTLKRASMV
jgi:hypothetical protein